MAYFSSSKAQGTTEYLVVIAVVVVLSLVVVGILVSQTGSASDVSATTSKISQSSGAISISEAVVDVDGNGLITLTNNSGSTFVLTRISVDGFGASYSGVSLLQGDEKTFSLGDIGSSCSCVGVVSGKRTCDVVVYTQSEYGLENQFATSVSVDCVSVARTTVSAVVQPVSYAITLNVKDSFNEANLSGFNVDCDGTAYDLTNQSSPLSFSFKGGNTYSCVFSKTGYSSTTSLIAVNSSQSLSVYMSPSNSLHFSGCITLNTPDGNYILDSNIGSGGACVIVAADNVKIYGNGYKITGDVNASNSGARAYTGLRINSLTVDGNISAKGDNNTIGSALVGGTVTILNSTATAVTTTGGIAGGTGTGGAAGAITITNSTIPTITASGGQGYFGGTGATVNVGSSTMTTITTTGGSSAVSGGLGGAVIATNSNLTTINTTGGAGQSASAAGAVTVTNSTLITITAVGGAGGNNGGGAGGAVTATNSTVTTINTIAGTAVGMGRAGGAVTATNSNITTITAFGALSQNWHGGNGGAVTLANSTITTIANYGGAAVSATRLGGNGGVVTINSTSPIIMTQISGWGGNSPLGTAGNGGVVSITAPSINFTNIVVNISNGIAPGANGTPGRFTLNYTTSFVDTNSFYDSNFRLRVVNGYGDVNFSSTITSSFTNLSSNFILASNSVSLNSTSAPALNVDANITFNLNGLGITNLQIKKSGVDCNSPDCNFISYNPIMFSVTNWINSSVYTIAQINVNGCSAIGGILTVSGDYCINTFDSNGTFTVPSGSLSADVLVVAGGGGGGNSESSGCDGGGGGGAGGLIYSSSYSVSAGNTSIVIGAGGIKNSGYPPVTGSNGGNSSFGALVATGGGAGGSDDPTWDSNLTKRDGVDGGSGGGGAGNVSSTTARRALGVAGQGNNGGISVLSSRSGGGGGGAGGNDSNSSALHGGNGGIGLQYDINGSNIYYAAGGAGGGGCSADAYGGTGGSGIGGAGGNGANRGAINGTDAIAKTGSGGGGGWHGGNGSSGIVIVRYPKSS